MVETRREQRRRLRTTLAFVAITVASTVGLAISTANYQHTNRLLRQVRAVALQAKTLAAAQAAEQAENRKTRSAQIAELHAVDVRDCTRFHHLVKLQTTTATAALKRAEATPNLGDTPAQRAAVAALNAAHIASLKRYLADLAMANCVKVKPLPALGSGG